ncbi:hypothetical protein Fcan01_23326 [Folsomia candida]|uniref:Uncharacterized protein n=1 Tax=Folsomia candida TaxID=158441 RepID=A0A226D8Q2_FOLCA|nr:hypothetical protein Fcan01_23326 [Folsomia candida]
MINTLFVSSKCRENGGSCSGFWNTPDKDRGTRFADVVILPPLIIYIAAGITVLAIFLNFVGKVSGVVFANIGIDFTTHGPLSLLRHTGYLPDIFQRSFFIKPTTITPRAGLLYIFWDFTLFGFAVYNTCLLQAITGHPIVPPEQENQIDRSVQNANSLRTPGSSGQPQASLRRGVYPTRYPRQPQRATRTPRTDPRPCAPSQRFLAPRPGPSQILQRSTAPPPPLDMECPPGHVYLRCEEIANISISGVRQTSRTLTSVVPRDEYSPG